MPFARSRETYCGKLPRRAYRPTLSASSAGLNVPNRPMAPNRRMPVAIGSTAARTPTRLSPPISSFVRETLPRIGKYRIRTISRTPTIREDLDLESTSIPSVSGSMKNETLFLFCRKSHRKIAHPKHRNWPYS